MSPSCQFAFILVAPEEKKKSCFYHLISNLYWNNKVFNSGGVCKDIKQNKRRFKNKKLEKNSRGESSMSEMYRSIFTKYFLWFHYDTLPNDKSYSRSVNILFFLRTSFCKHAKPCLFHVCWRVKVTDVQLDKLLPFVGKVKCLICTITVHISNISCVHVSGSPCVPVCIIISQCI